MISYTLIDGTNGGLASNYSLANDNATGDITAKALSITANNQTKCSNSTFSFVGNEFSSGGLIGGDNISSVTLNSTGASSSSTSSNIVLTTYNIIPSAAIGSGLSNYTITYYNGTLTVNPNPIVSLPTNYYTCAGTWTILTATISGGTSPYSHLWTGVTADSLNATLVRNPSYENNTASDNSLTYTVTDNKGCQTSAPTTVHVSAAAVGGTLSPASKTICSGKNDTITLSGYTGSVTLGNIRQTIGHQAPQ